MLSFIGNVLWFVLAGGIFSGLLWLLCGLLLCCTIVGIPAGVAAFRIASFAFFPFGKDLVAAEAIGEKRITGTALANFLWVILAGLWIGLFHIVSGIYCFLACVLIIPLFFGAPLWGAAHFKLAQVSFAPLGKRIVSADMAKTIRQRNINAVLDAKAAK